MFKNTFRSVASVAALLGAIAAPAFAASSYYLVVPISTATKAPVQDITVTLAGAELPKATVSKSYSESLRPYLSVTGDASFDAAAAHWSLVKGVLPEGLTLDGTTGSVVGRAIDYTSGPASFTVLATYKGKDGQAVYTIEVGGELLTVVQIAAGALSTCAVTTANAAKCWGSNSVGSLGDGTKTSRATPVQVAGLTSGVTQVAVGAGTACAIHKGAAKCWGYNSNGQLGDGTQVDSLVPVQVTGLTSATAHISVSTAHGCAVTTAGAIRCWGYDGLGALGRGSLLQDAQLPGPVIGFETGGAKQVVVGDMHTCAVTTAEGLKCWGANMFGQLGVGNNPSYSATPLDVAGIASGVFSVSAHRHTCAAMRAGGLKCWGFNSAGQLGLGDEINRFLPVDVPGVLYPSDVSVGQSNTCVADSGAVKCWGANSDGQLGSPGPNSNLPVPVPGMDGGWTWVSVGMYHVCAMHVAEQSVKCWGEKADGKLGDHNKSSGTPTDVLAGH